MVGVLRELDVERKGGHTAAADMAYLYAMTQVWFTVERNYKVCSLLFTSLTLPISQPVLYTASVAKAMCICNERADILRSKSSVTNVSFTNDETCSHPSANDLLHSQLSLAS